MFDFESSFQQSSEHLVASSRVDDLHRLREEPKLNFGLLTRDSITFQNSIEEVIKKSPGKTNFTFDASENIDLIGAILDEEFDLQSDCAFEFYSDVIKVAGIFLKLTQSKEIGIQLEVVKSDLCRFFHTDRIPYRLVTTYKGPTTEWLSNSNVNRVELGKHSNEKVLIDKTRVHKLPDYSLAIFKGEKLVPGESLVHRSPPLVNGNEKRLIMRMDTLDI